MERKGQNDGKGLYHYKGAVMGSEGRGNTKWRRRDAYKKGYLRRKERGWEK